MNIGTVLGDFDETDIRQDPNAMNTVQKWISALDQDKENDFHKEPKLNEHDFVLNFIQKKRSRHFSTGGGRDNVTGSTDVIGA